MVTTEQILRKFLRRTGTARSRELVAAGVARSALSRMVAAGTLARVARGLYALPDYQGVNTRRW